MSFKEQKITTGKYLTRFIKFLLTPGSVGRLKLLLTTRLTDEISMIDKLELHAAERPNDAALLFEEQRISWGELNGKANQMANYFRSRGVTYGDKIAVNMENRPELLFVVMGAQKLGAVAGMINTSQTHEALAHSLKLIEPKLIVVGAECAANMESVNDIIEAHHSDKLLSVSDAGHADPGGNYLDLMAAIADQDTANITPDKVLTLGTPTYYIFTSGTTGLPKGQHHHAYENSACRYAIWRQCDDAGAGRCVLLRLAALSLKRAGCRLWQLLGRWRDTGAAAQILSQSVLGRLHQIRSNGGDLYR